MDDEGGEPIYVQAQGLRLDRLPQKSAILQYNFLASLIYKVGLAKKHSDALRRLLITIYVYQVFVRKHYSGSCNGYPLC